ncbi:hypothetical protein BKA70DRAFT_357011 [Coprinopsis sp. MPI-PUGE-AT-0042]|nr:hypothetical protein BKA70DRAFT_357011 [Coprinopsis sp. MPI-PUGE-AT-0042]
MPIGAYWYLNALYHHHHYQDSELNCPHLPLFPSHHRITPGCFLLSSAPMALLATSNAVPEPFAGGSRGQTGETVHGSVLVGTTGMFTDAHNLQIVNSNLTVAGRDVHNYYHSESKTDIWVILKLVTNFRDIYHAMLEKATPGTGMWLIKRKRFRCLVKA